MLGTLLVNEGGEQSAEHRRGTSCLRDIAPYAASCLPSTPLERGSSRTRA